MSSDPSESIPPETNPNISEIGRAMFREEIASVSKPAPPWLPPTAEELGQLLPGYEIISMLGRGGMGAVYMGKQASLDRPVAIKILSGALESCDIGFKERFKNEARAMAKLNHPGIVAVHDFGETSDGLLYIVMEYVEGTDVSRMIAAETRLHTEYAMAITAHVCDALAYAHARGIIHRDIKPANIMVGYDGVVKIADFGLAKVHEDGRTLDLTMSGVAMGTMHFMAPEASEEGVMVDLRADIYSVGVMLYQMLTGKLPRGMFEMPSLQVPGLDPRYDGIIARALREDRDARYQNAGEMREDLDAIVTQPVGKVERVGIESPTVLSTVARPQRPGRKDSRNRQPTAHRKTRPNDSRGLFGVILVLILMLIGGIVFWFYTQRVTNSGAPANIVAARPLPSLDPTITRAETSNLETTPTKDQDLSAAPATVLPTPSLDQLPIRPPAPAPAPAPKPSPASVRRSGWRSLIEENPEVFSRIPIKTTADDWRSMQINFLPLFEEKNLAIRLRAKSALYLITRWTPYAPLGKKGFQVSVHAYEGSSRMGGGWVREVTNGFPTSYIPIQPVLLPFPQDYEYELELRSYGNRIIVLVNDTIEFEATIDDFPGKGLAIMNSGGPCHFKYLEWMPLDNEGNALYPSDP